MYGVGGGIWGHICQLAHAFPNTHSLEITCFDSNTSIALPPPSQWPQLVCIRLPYSGEYSHFDADAVWPHIAAYMPQLTRLIFPTPDVLYGHCCDTLFNVSQSPTHVPITNTPHSIPPSPTALPTTFPLTHFKYHLWLDDELLDALVTHAPHLQYLSVRELYLYGDEHAGKVWGLQTLDLNFDGDCTGHIRNLDSSSMFWQLASLPRPRAGRTCLRAECDLELIVSDVHVSAPVSHGFCLCQCMHGLIAVHPCIDGPSFYLEYFSRCCLFVCLAFCL